MNEKTMLLIIVIPNNQLNGPMTHCWDRASDPIQRYPAQWFNIAKEQRLIVAYAFLGAGIEDDVDLTFINFPSGI